MDAIEGLWTAAQLGLVTFVVIKNRRCEALYEFAAASDWQRTVSTSLPDIDCCALARSQGVNAISVDSTDTLDKALRIAFSVLTEPTLVEVTLDRSVTIDVLSDHGAIEVPSGVPEQRQDDDQS